MINKRKQIIIKIGQLVICVAVFLISMYSAKYFRNTDELITLTAFLFAFVSIGAFVKTFVLLLLILRKK